MNQPAVTEADLQAWVDDQLPPARAAAVEAYLAAHPDEALRLQAYRAQNHALRTHFNPVLEQPLPGRLLAPPADWGRRAQRFAAGLAIALAGGAAGWMLHQPANAPLQSADSAALSRQAAIAHVVYSPDVRRPVEIGADQEAQLVAWLSKRIGTPMRPPKLGKLGYELIGGRLLPGQSGPVAQFMYQDSAAQRLTLYVSTEQAHNSDTGFRFAQEGPVNVFYWIDGKFGYALSASVPRPALSSIAAAVYEQLEK